MNLRFFALPAHLVVPPPKLLPHDPWVEPEVPNVQGVVEHALIGTEFRDERSKDRLHTLFSAETERLGSPGPEFSPSVLFAKPPGDLPALLRLADQLEVLATREEGERALVWQCRECGTRYAVPVALVRDVAIRCERCSQRVELRPDRALTEEALMDPVRGTVNQARRELAGFFREAMARGWPVLVAREAKG